MATNSIRWNWNWLQRHYTIWSRHILWNNLIKTHNTDTQTHIQPSIMPVKKQGTWPLYYLLLLYNVKLNPFRATSFPSSSITSSSSVFYCIWLFSPLYLLLLVLLWVFFCSFRFYFDDKFSCIDTFVCLPPSRSLPFCVCLHALPTVI